MVKLFALKGYMRRNAFDVGSNPTIPTKTFKGCWQQDCQCDVDIKSCSRKQFLMEFYRVMGYPQTG